VTRRVRGDRQEAVETVLGRLALQVPGRHNLLNALATVSVGLELGLDFARIAAGLGEFRGAERRFEIKGEPRGILVIDDYAHHPTEIAAVLAAARALDRRLLVVLQPHRFSRAAALMEAFGPSLAGADHIVLTDIYAAGEEPVPGVSIEALAAAVRRSVRVPVDLVPRLEAVAPAVARLARAGDAILTLGAGSIASVSDRIVALLEGRGDDGEGCG
jgi:UDP-N-acetylmuramate--alanine ligase